MALEALVGGKHLRFHPGSTLAPNLHL
jgi:hypothetical protein